MTQAIRTRPKQGDIIEISTPEGLAFAQYTHRHPQFGALLNVLPGVFASAPDDFDGLLREEPQFTTFFPLGAACARKIVRIVANRKVPARFAAFPQFRMSVRTAKGRGPWWLWDGSVEQQIGELKPGMERLPIRGIINDTMLVERIRQGWRHEDDI